MTPSGEGNWQPKKSVQHTFFLISEKQLCTLFVVVQNNDKEKHNVKLPETS